MSEGSEEANGMPHCVPLGPPIFWSIRNGFQDTLHLNEKKRLKRLSVLKACVYLIRNMDSTFRIPKDLRKTAKIRVLEQDLSSELLL